MLCPVHTCFRPRSFPAQLMVGDNSGTGKSLTLRWGAGPPPQHDTGGALAFPPDRQVGKRPPPRQRCSEEERILIITGLWLPDSAPYVCPSPPPVSHRRTDGNR